MYLRFLAVITCVDGLSLNLCVIWVKRGWKFEFMLQSSECVWVCKYLSEFLKLNCIKDIFLLLFLIFHYFGIFIEVFNFALSLLEFHNGWELESQINLVENVAKKICLWMSSRFINVIMAIQMVSCMFITYFLFNYSAVCWLSKLDGYALSI